MEDKKQMEEKAAEQLNSFIYTVAHELKTPAREISLYAEFIEEDNRDKLTMQSIKDLHSIRRTCERMTDMVKRLMEYSKADLKNIDRIRINTQLLIHQCFEELMRAEPNRKVTLTMEDLPELTGDMFLIKLMVMNILSNSIKFTRSRTKAKIMVFATARDGYVAFHFRDNGIGFDMNYADQIFEAFERLESNEAYEGNGIGLATVRRIVQRFDGKASIMGWPEKGCEVTVCFPEEIIYPDIKVSRQECSVVKIGIIGDLTGIASKEERSKQAAYQLAVKEINEVGGIDGKKIELLIRDDRSQSDLTNKAALELTQQEHVDVLMGSTLSPSRDIMQRYAQQTKTLYLNTQQTEGGVSGHYVFCLSAMPEQQMEKMLAYLFKKYGSKCYIVAADYNYGILSAEWVKYLVPKLGGEVVGIEYLDEKMMDFTSVIDRILQVQTDVLFSMCVYPNQDRFYLQWHERGLNHIPNATTQVAAEYPLNVELKAPVLENMYVMASFIEELKTPRAQQYVKKFRSVYNHQNVPYMNMDTETAYTAMYLYKRAVEMAGTTETEAVISALESGSVFYDGPGGRVTVRGEDHHTIRTMSCFRIDKDHHAEEVFRTGPQHSDYIESMIKRNTGVQGGIKALGINAENLQYNMLLDKIR